MKNKYILLDHGSGGKAMGDLIKNTIIKRFKNSVSQNMDDAAVFECSGSKLAFTTDSFVVDPIFFPGGNIGDLAVNGTINDLSMVGAKPEFMSVGFIIEEGFKIDEFEKILDSMAEAAIKCNIKIVTGDTKVVAKGAADKIFINTSAIGSIYKKVNLSSKLCEPGDKIIISGPIGEHGIAVMAKRNDLKFESVCKSDTKPLWEAVSAVIDTCEKMGNINCLKTFRDPTRGGLAATLNEFAENSNVGIEINEQFVPISNGVLSACEMLGFDPFNIANEGIFVCVAKDEYAVEIVNRIKKVKHFEQATVIGTVIDKKNKVIIKSEVGSKRIVHLPTGELLPRIC